MTDECDGQGVLIKTPAREAVIIVFIETLESKNAIWRFLLPNL